MALQDKYQTLIAAAQKSGATNLQVRDQGNVLYIDGEVGSEAAKKQLWDMYNQIDPDYRSGDLILNLNVTGAASGSKLLVSTQSSNLNVRQGPGTDHPIVGKAAHQEIVTLVERSNDQWWRIKTDSGVEGYASTQFLSVQ